MTDYPRCARPGQGGHEWERLERDLQRVLGQIPKQQDPNEAERVHRETWNRRKTDKE